MAARFIGVELEIESPRPLGYIFDALSGAGVVSFDYRESRRGFSVSFECARAGMSSDPDIQIAKFCDLFVGCNDQAKAVWNSAYRKTFNLAYRIEESTECFRSELQPATLARIAELGASVMLTIYPSGSEGCGEPEES